MRPIPVSALSEAVTIGGFEYSKILIENHVRFSNSSYGSMQESQYLLMIDAVNTPFYQEIKTKLLLGESVQYNNKFHVIKSVEPLIDRLRGVEHHVEVTLL